MKKIVLLIILISCVTISRAQLFEDFEGDTFPPEGWLVTSVSNYPGNSWTRIGALTSPPVVFNGNYAAFVNGLENIGPNNTAEKWLISNPTTITGNSILSFWSRPTINGFQNTTYQVRILANGEQDDLASYEILVEYIDNEEPLFYVNKSVSLEEYEGQTVHIAFVIVVNQPTAAPTGERWIIDDISFVDEVINIECGAPINLASSNIGEIGVVLSWTNVSSILSHEVYITEAGGNIPDESTVGIETNSHSLQISNLTCNTDYTFYVRSICQNETYTNWSAGFNFTTPSCADVNDPIVTVDTLLNTPEEILNNVILNSDCGTISNVVTQGPCGIGYFNANASDFPFQEGLIIRSGQANLSQGPYLDDMNSLSSVCSQTGDQQLNSIRQSLGLTGPINDVSFVKFDIVPTTNVLSFNFIFASNEYGENQCYFSDLFGFILTDLTTNQTSNIAVIPGTNVPVSVTTIRDEDYNSSCESVNPQFFDTYNVGNPDAGLNMRGYTMPMTAIASVIPNHTYSLKLSVGDYQGTSFDSAVFIEGGSLFLGNQCADNFQLIAFFDSNNNGIKDEGEPNFLNGNLNYQVNDTGDTVSTTSHNGIFHVFPENQSDSYDFTYSINSELAGFYAEPISFDDVVYSQTESNVYYIPIVNTTAYNDVSVSLVATNQPAAGFNYKNKIYFTNNGIDPAAGTLSFEKDPTLTISNTNNLPGLATILPTGFTYNYTNLMPSETRIIDVWMSVPPIPTVAIGYLVTNTVSISTSSIGDNLHNNTASLTKPIVASYDPNDKNESHGDKIALADFTENDYLYYTIRFQNTGTTNATFVRVEDVLDAQLNPESLRMLTASHPYVLERINNELVWKFDNIQLVPQIVNENASIGFVHFKIKPNSGIAVGDIIPNTADIYFDFNPVIVTNTFETEFVENLSTPDFTNSTVVLSPNPTKDKLQIQLNGSDSIQQISVYDVVGKRVYFKNKLEVNATAVDFSNLHQGVYMVEVITASNQKLVNKVIKN